MTRIITTITDESILMASDTRLNYHKELKDGNGNKYQAIHFAADCIRKTFFLPDAQLGIQFLGIGYLPEGNERYPLSYFVEDIDHDGGGDITKRAEAVYENVQSIISEEDTGNYVNGVMSGYSKDKIPYIFTFNGYTGNELTIRQCNTGGLVDSESDIKQAPADEKETIDLINSCFNKSVSEKPWSIGSDIDLLRITPSDKNYVQTGGFLFDGSYKELMDSIKNGKIETINFNPPKIEKLNL